MPENETKKIAYVKPQVVDLGPVTTALGAVDCPNGNAASGQCDLFGTGAGSCISGGVQHTLTNPGQRRPSWP